MIESDEDRALFFDEDEFGATATVTLDGVLPFDVPVIFDTRPPFTATNFKGFRGTDDMGRDMGAVSGAQPRILGGDARLPLLKGGRGTITVAGPIEALGKTYIPFKTYPDGTGLTIVELKIA